MSHGPIVTLGSAMRTSTPSLESFPSSLKATWPPSDNPVRKAYGSYGLLLKDLTSRQQITLVQFA